MSNFKPCNTKNLFVHKKFESRIFLYREKEVEQTADSYTLRTLVSEGDFCLIFLEKDGGEERLREFLPEFIRRPGSRISFEHNNNLYRMMLTRMGEGKFRLDGTVNFPIHNYGLEISAGGIIQVCGEDGNEYLELDGRYNFYRLIGFFYTGQGLRLEMEDLAGCFSFSLDGLTTLKKLGVFLCYTKEGQSLKKAKVQPISLRSDSFSISVSLDVLHPEQRERTFFTLPAGRYDTAFPTSSGDNLVLELEQKGDAVLLFSVERNYKNNTSYRYHLVPHGSFTIVSEAGDFLPGGSGLEYIRFTKGSILSFYAGKGAHFPTGQKEPETSGQTAYLSVGGTYYAQGQEAAFFSRENGLDYAFLEIPFCQINQDLPFSMLPLGLTGEEFEQEYPEYLSKLDTDCLQPFRSTSLAAGDDNFQVQEETKRAINERGTVISYAGGSDSLACLELADKFRFANVRGKLKKALLCAKPFVVVTDTKAFLQEAEFLSEEPLFQIEGWQFDFSPSQWSDQTVLIIKYAADKSIVEYAEETSEWSYPAEAEDRAKAAQILKNRLKEISEESAALFYDRNWCGAVLLELPVASGNLPAEIRFLANVGKPPHLSLQYMAFDRRTVDEEGEITPSKVSGLIHYENRDFSAPDRQYDFYYRLNLFYASFENSEQKDFYCELSVALFYLFGSPLSAVDSSTGNYIPIKGWRNVETDTEETARFLFALKDDRNYYFSGSAIERMEINGAKLLSSKEGNRVNFYFSGGIFFETYESDLFSFGDELQDEQEAEEQKSCPLRFLDLEVDVEGEEYAGSSDNMKFLMEESSVRRNSLGASFPLEVKKLGLYRNCPPEQFGYEGISADGITQQQLGDNWTGLELDIHLGGMGHLHRRWM